jgi:hypothetical protein
MNFTAKVKHSKYNEGDRLSATSKDQTPFHTTQIQLPTS